MGPLTVLILAGIITWLVMRFVVKAKTKVELKTIGAFFIVCIALGLTAFLISLLKDGLFLGYGDILLWALIVYTPFMIAVYFLAKRYGRPTVNWLIISLFISPVVCLIILLSLGESDEKKRERIREEELYRKSIREGTI